MRRSFETCYTRLSDVVVPSKKYDVLRNITAERKKENKEMGVGAVEKLVCTKEYNSAEEIVETRIGLDSLRSAENLLGLCYKIDDQMRKVKKRGDNALGELSRLEGGRLAEAEERLIQVYERAIEHCSSWAEIATNEALEANKRMLAQEQEIFVQFKTIHQFKTDERVMTNSRKKNLHKLYKLCSQTHDIQKNIKFHLLSWNGMKAYQEKNVKNFIKGKILGEASLPSPTQGKKYIDQLEKISQQIPSRLGSCRDAGGSGNSRDNDAGGSGPVDQNSAGWTITSLTEGPSGNSRDNDPKRNAITEVYKSLDKYLHHVLDKGYTSCLRYANQRWEEVCKELDGYISVREEVAKLEEEKKKMEEQFHKYGSDYERLKKYAKIARKNYNIARESAIRKNQQLGSLLLEEKIPAFVQFEYEKLQQRKQGIGSSKPTDPHETRTPNQRPGKEKALVIG